MGSQMFAVQRKFIPKRVRVVLKGFTFMTVTLLNLSAHATTIVAVFTNNEFVIGADGRMIDASIHDETCKIAALNNKVAFANYGATFVTPKDGAPRIDMYQVAKQIAVSGQDISELAARFGPNAAAKFNTLPASGRRPPGAIDPMTVGIFGGFNADESPQLSFIPISYSETANNFIIGALTTHTTVGKFNLFSPFNFSSEIVNGTEFNAIKAIRYISDAERLAREIESYILQTIARRPTDMINGSQIEQIGGTPTVLIIEKGQRPRWYRRAKECPDLSEA